MYRFMTFVSIYVQVTLNDDCQGLLPLGPCLLLTTWMRESHRRPQTMVRHVCVCFMCPPSLALRQIHANVYTNFGLVSAMTTSQCVRLCDREVKQGRDK